MKRRKKISGLGDMGGIASGLLPILGGYLLGNVVEKQFLSGTTYGNIVKLGGGIALAAMSKGLVAQLGVGMALNGAVDIAQPALESAGLGLLPPGMPARYVAGITDGQVWDGQQYPFGGGF
jgi:hypothetical protein